MPAVDYERAWLRLKAHLDSKPSHGKRDLFAEMARIEVESEVPEGQDLFDVRPLRGSQSADGDRSRVSAGSS